VGVVLGRRAGLAIAVGVLLQTLLFNHGGLTTLGINVIVLAVPALLAGLGVRHLRPAELVKRGWIRFTAVAAVTAIWLTTAVMSTQWIRHRIVSGEPFHPAAIDWWVADPLVAIAIGLAAVLAALLERRIEPDPSFALGLLLGAVTAYATVCLNALVLWAGGKPEVQDLAGMVLIAHLPVVAVESLGLGFVVVFLARARPEWLTTQRPDGSGNTSSNGTSH
jgi:ABC-type Co2+ transport system permease subunit